MVIKGEGIGKSIGFPTANIVMDDCNKLMPSLGVYAVFISLGERKYLGMLNIGKRPTFGENNHITIELNIFNFNQNIYNKKVTVTFLSKLRDEKKFKSKKDLVLQLKNDELWVQSRKLFLKFFLQKTPDYQAITIPVITLDSFVKKNKVK